MLGLLALTGVDDTPALVGLEEPENGVHPRRIQLIAELLKTQETLRQTQHIITTHSPILPDLLADDSLFAVRRLNGQTRIDPFSTWGPLARRDDISQVLSDEENEASGVCTHHERGLRCVRSRFSSRTTRIVKL